MRHRIGERGSSLPTVIIYVTFILIQLIRNIYFSVQKGKIFTKR